MKISKMILAVSLLITAVASADIDPRRDFQNPPVLRPIGQQQLVCANHQNVKSFTATLDERSFEPGHGLFHVVDAQFRDNYYTADQLTCVGNRIGEISCIGFINGTADSIVEIKLQQRSQSIVVASYKMIRGRGPSDNLRCSID